MQRKPVQIQISFFENFEKKNDFDRVTIEDKDEWEMQMHFHFLSEFAKAWPLCRVELTDHNYQFDFRCLLAAKNAEFPDRESHGLTIIYSIDQS